MAQYQDNLQTSNLQGDIDDAVEFLRQHVGFVTKEQWDLLQVIGRRYRMDVEAVAYDANFSLADEVQAQIQAVRAIRDRIMTPDGQLSQDITTREAKEVVSSGSTLLTSLMKFHEKVVNMERMRLLETSVIEALEEADQELKALVLAKMEEKLANLA